MLHTYSKKQKNFLMQYGIYAKKPMSTVIIHYAHNHWPNSFIALKLMSLLLMQIRIFSLLF